MNSGTVGIIQARIGSKRLPGKILAPIVDSHPLLEVLVTRLRSSGIQWWLATTNDPSDDVTAAWGEALSLNVYRGADWDVLSRFVDIIKLSSAEAVVRVTADNPFTDGATVQRVLLALRNAHGGISVVRGGGTERQFPLGFVPEAIRARDLLELHASIKDPASVHRTHVTSGISASKVLLFGDSSLPARPQWRWTVDTSVDLEMARASFDLFQNQWPNIGYAEIVAALDARPDVARMNEWVSQKPMEDG